jgi:hypothetical protein
MFAAPSAKEPKRRVFMEKNLCRYRGVLRQVEVGLYII